MWDGFSDSVRKRYALETREITVYHERDSSSEYQKDIPVLRTGPMTVRKFLQVFGSDIIREQVDQDAWAKSPFRAQHEEDFVIAPDGRFPNEIYQGKKHGMVIRVIRNTGLEDSHMSETALDDIPLETYDRVIDNNGTLDDLKQTADDIVKNLLD